ncbi:hypothetical protein Vretimale_2238, partial [Volvox reticuliferus]
FETPPSLAPDPPGCAGRAFQPSGRCRSSPLRGNALTLPPTPHPDRRLVDLRFHVHTDGRAFLLDVVTGLLYVASPYILAVAAEVAEAVGALPPPTGPATVPHTHGGVGMTRRAGAPVLSPRLLGAGGHVGRGIGGPYHASTGGAADLPSPAFRPPLLLPYPDLAGKLQNPDNRLLPAQNGSGVGLVCRALERLLAEEDRASALYKVLDRDGRGLNLSGLHQLISDAASLTSAEVAFAAVLLDRRGSGRVTLADLREATQTVHYTAAALGASPSAAAPVTLTLTRVEARALDVLHRAAQVLQREARLVWLLVAKAGAAGTGQLERATAASLLREVLQPYLSPHEIRVTTAYLAMMTPDKDGNITADEVIQLLRAVPMRLRLPYSDVMAVGGAAATAATAAGREIIFAAGFGGPVAADGTLPLIQPSVPGGGGGGRGSDSYGLDVEGEDDNDRVNRDGAAGRDAAARKGTRGSGDDDDTASAGMLQYSEADLAQDDEEGDFGLVGQNDDGDEF